MPHSEDIEHEAEKEINSHPQEVRKAEQEVEKQTEKEVERDK